VSDLELTDRQAKFALLYNGNGVETARKAGYTGSYGALGKTAHDLLKNPKVVAAIRERESQELSPLIASRIQRQKFWSRMMLDSKLDMSCRLRASELLAKSEGDFTEKIIFAPPPRTNSEIDFSGISTEKLMLIAGMARCPSECCKGRTGGAPLMDIPDDELKKTALYGPEA